MLRKRCVVAILAIVGLVAATVQANSQYDVFVSSQGNSRFPQRSTFVISPTKKTLPKSDPEFLEYSSYLTRVLSQKGYRPVKAGQAADFEVALDYGISNVATKLEASSGIGVETTVVNHKPVTYSYPATFQRYSRFVQVDAFDLKAYRSSKQWKQAWTTKMLSEGYTKDMRIIVPRMLAAGYNYLGHDSGRVHCVGVNETDPAVTWVMGSLNPPMP